MRKKFEDYLIRLGIGWFSGKHLGIWNEMLLFGIEF